MEEKTKPFVKWAGGKTQFLDAIDILLPKNYQKLVEPFVGGGALCLSLQPERLIINDANKELIITYQVIKKQPRELLKLLSEYEENHSKEFYQILRSQEIRDLTELGIAARFIYLNKTGFNGLYRVNSKGVFNVPWGQKEKAKLADKKNILAISKYLNKIECQIINQDYQQLLSSIKKDDFLFVDPPYDSENGNGFTSYTADKFTRENQQELAQFLRECEKKGAKWLLTNHATDFIKDLYKDYQQFTKKAQRFINCQGNKRVGSAQEIFIWNYELTEEQKKDLEFEKFFDTIKHTNITLEKLVDWEKIKQNLTNYENDLNILNSLLINDKKELEERIEQVWKNNPNSFQLLPLFLAVKEGDFSWLEQKEVNFWKEDSLKLEKVEKVINDSGLADLFTSGQIKDLKDYVLGVEAGLDSHSRKNRGGKLMESTVKKLLIDCGIKYDEQVSVPIGEDKKKFDFLIKIKGEEYYLETNFFNSSGSKISEIIRVYRRLQQLAKEEEKKFLWITDGKGLKSVKEQMKDAYFVGKDFLFTLSSFEKWLKEKSK